MNELYELAKQVDVMVLFCLIYGCAIAGFVNIVMDIFKWIHDKWKKQKEKKSLTTVESDEA